MLIVLLFINLVKRGKVASSSSNSNVLNNDESSVSVEEKQIKSDKESKDIHDPVDDKYVVTPPCNTKKKIAIKTEDNFKILPSKSCQSKVSQNNKRKETSSSSSDYQDIIALQSFKNYKENRFLLFKTVENPTKLFLGRVSLILTSIHFLLYSC